MAESEEQLIQGLLIISCSHDIKPLSLIEKIITTLNPKPNESQELSPKLHNFGSDKEVKCYDLRIDNKYYSTDIYLFDIQNRDLISKQFADSVHGVVLYFDNNEESSFVGVKSWLPFIESYNCEIKQLVCETADHNCSVKRDVIQKWCIDNEFELIELNPIVEDEDEDESIDDFKESNGIIRITQSLQAYNWPFMTLKDSPQYTPSSKFKNLIDKEIFNSITGNSSDNYIPVPNVDNDSEVETNTEQKIDSLIESIEINNSLLDEENESFENLFTKFSQMKVEASRLNDGERRLYAEKVTLAFWRAVGGDNEEIEGLDESEETIK